MKRIKSKQSNKAPPELSFFSLEAAISEARATTEAPQSNSSSSSRKLFSAASSLLGKKPFPSQQSLATNASFATANENSVPPNESATPAASYFYSDNDDETDEGYNFGNDPLAVLSRKASATRTTPTEISFSIEYPEETMASKKKSSTVRPPTAVAAKDPLLAFMDLPSPPAAAKPAAAKTAPVVQADEPHFDVAQTVYGATKDAWAWGKTVAVISNVLDLTEAVALKALDVTVHMDLAVIDDKIKPQLKKLDDEVVTPAILAVWKVVEPALGKADEMVLKPVMTDVVPRVLGPLGFGSEASKKEEEKKTAMIDMSPTPEVVPAFN